MKQEFIIPGRLDGMNEYTNACRTGWQVGARMKRMNQNLALDGIYAFHVKPMDKVRIHFTWVEPNRKRDPDNIASAKKYIIDALVEAGVIKNDGWKNIIGLTDEFVCEPGSGCVIVDLEDE